MDRKQNPDLLARNAKPNSRTSFGDFCLGLYLITGKDGTKTWRCNYTLNGYHLVILGRYPDMTFSEARLERLKVKDMVRRKISPAHSLANEKAANDAPGKNTVRKIAGDWLAQAKGMDWSDVYTNHVRARLRNHVLGAIGDRPISLVTTQEIEGLVGGLDARGMRPQAVHVKHHLQCLFDYAFSHRLVEENIVRRIGRTLAKRKRNDTREIKRARVGTIEQARQVLNAVESCRAGGFLKLAHRLIALTAVRKMEAVDARWDEFDEVKQTWTIPGERMKGRRGQQQEHVIPLPPQALEVFKAAQKLAQVLGIQSSRVFPGRGGKSLGRSALNDMMERVLPTIGLAGKHTIHGWRGTFSTLQNTDHPAAKMIIDVMLAHKTKSNVEGRYNESVYLVPRLEMACTWADKLLAGAPSAFQVAGIKQHHDNVVPFKKEAA